MKQQKVHLLPGLFALFIFVSLTGLLSCALPGYPPKDIGNTDPSASTPGAILLSSSTAGASATAGASVTPGGLPTPGPSLTPGSSATPGASPTAGPSPTATASPTPVIPPASGGSDLLISRNVPAYDPSGPVPEATDASYDTYWWPDSTPTWLAYDLSSVPPAHRSTVLSVWYNPSFQYDHTLVGDYSYNLPHNYSLEANAAPGGGTPPSSNWVSLLSISGNQYHSRQHVLSLTGYSWLRLRITSADNNSPRLNWDLYDASSIRSDDWIFFGDSITAGSMGQDTVGGVPAFASLINASQPTHFPVEEDGGIGYLTSDDGAQHISTWLALFPGKYVGLSYGTNDANGCVNASSFYQNYVTMVQAVLAAGKIPVIPHLPWGRTSNIQNCGPALNAKIDALYQAFPQIIKGPDLWAYFQAHQSLISSDNIHPTDPGFGAYRQQWANTMLAEVYG